MLPASFTSSAAYSITDDIIDGIATDSSGNVYAIAWTVPEPASLSLMTMLGLGLRRRRRVQK